MNKRTYTHKRWLVILLLAVIVLFYPFTLFFRGIIVPLYANTFYRGSVEVAYVNTFTDLNKELAGIGFVIPPKAPTCFNGVRDNGDVRFHYISETVPCITEADSQPLTVTSTFKDQWAAESSKIEATLHAHNWMRRNTQASDKKLDELYQTFDPTYGSQTAFSKSFGKYTCALTFEYANYSGRPATENNTKAYVHEKCTRTVSFFGGYSG